MDAYFCQDKIKDPGNNRLFSCHLLLNNHSNQERDSSITRLNFPESIEELVE